jgi:hypothetical protein
MPRNPYYSIPHEWLDQFKTWSSHQLGLLADACHDQGVSYSDMPKVIAIRQKMLADAAAELVTLDATIKAHRQEAMRLKKRKHQLLALLGKPF